jgi:hypothetical protein
MPIKDQANNYVRKFVKNRPAPAAARRMVRKCKAKAIRFSDDGIVPNNPRWPLILYRRDPVFRRI